MPSRAPRWRIFAIEDAGGGTLALATTADLRRAARARLAASERSSRRADLRAAARIVRAATVGSSFEADWAYLQHARPCLPATYRSLLDRWQAWFVHCDAAAPFPQWTRTNHPKATATDTTEATIGPFPDKHAAARYIELLEDAFDLCRYHHLLVQAPHASACAYKEMGRCPAPCDGSVSLDHYRAMVRASIAFASMPVERGRRELEDAMQRASATLDFEAARRCRDRLDRTAAALKPEFQHAGRLDDFRRVAVTASERAGWARVMLIVSGWIAPMLDFAVDADDDALRAVIGSLQEASAVAAAAPLDDHSVENLGLVCWHLFRPRASRHPLRFLDLESLDAAALRAALKPERQSETPAHLDAAAVAEQEISG